MNDKWIVRWRWSDLEDSVWYSDVFDSFAEASAQVDTLRVDVGRDIADKLAIEVYRYSVAERML